MAIRKPFTETKSAQREATFQGTYSWSKKTGMKEGMEKYIVFLGLDKGIYQSPSHRVLPKDDGEGNKVSFKSHGKFGNYILCKSYDEEGNFIGEAECCKLQKALYNQYKDEPSKRTIAGMSWKLYLPVLIFGSSETDPKAYKTPVSKISIKTWDFAYLEMSMSTWTSELKKLEENLKTEGVIDYDVEGEELQKLLMDHVQHSIVKVSAMRSDKGLPYEKLLTFIPFTNQSIGKATGEYERITQYFRVKAVHSEMVDFLNLFDAEVDGLLCSDWTESELKDFVYGTKEATSQPKAPAQKVEAVKETEDDVMIDDTEVPYDDNGFIDEPASEDLDSFDEPDLEEEDVSFSAGDESDFFAEV